MGYELWRFAALSLSLFLSIVRSNTLYLSSSILDETIAFLLLLLWRGGYSSFERDTGSFTRRQKRRLKFWRGGREEWQLTSLLRIFCEIVYNRGLPPRSPLSLLLVRANWTGGGFFLRAGGEGRRRCSKVILDGREGEFSVFFLFFLLLKLSFKVTRRGRVCCSRQRWNTGSSVLERALDCASVVWRVDLVVSIQSSHRRNSRGM